MLELIVGENNNNLPPVEDNRLHDEAVSSPLLLPHELRPEAEHPATKLDLVKINRCLLLRFLPFNNLKYFQYLNIYQHLNNPCLPSPTLYHDLQHDCRRCFLESCSASSAFTQLFSLMSANQEENTLLENNVMIT